MKDIEGIISRFQIRHPGAIDKAKDAGVEAVKWPAKELRILKLFGPTWCFSHNAPMPCIECQATPKFIGMCFDCKAEYAGPGEAYKLCDCYGGCKIRPKRLYRYP